eukprot:TRINITY_DN5456_c0_g4_i1.p1 TRINITY_DN5456_c0_g4~~TRINITY_DN5456_c0_g4_i1.p1  ORF type:complete len:503 (+),score=88.88 TRINITY_DN5456_c0_g4_i1:98-1606(+)
MKSWVALPVGWYVGFDGRSRPVRAGVGGNDKVLATRDAAYGDVLFEEASVLTSVALQSDADLDYSGLKNAAAQMKKLNTAMAQCNLPDIVVPFLMRMTALNVEDICRAVAPLRALSAAPDKRAILPAFVLAQAFKKVFPTDSHKHLTADVIGPLIVVYIRGALPHTCGCKAQGSLFHTASLIPKRSRGANATYEAVKHPTDPGRYVLTVTALAPLRKDDPLVFAAHEDLWKDIQVLGSCCGGGDVPAVPRGPASVGKKLGLSLTAPDGVVLTHLPGRGGGGRVAFVLDNVFTREECDAMGGAAFDTWENTIQYHQMLKTGSPANYRLFKSGSDVHESIWHRIQKYCPHSWRGWGVGCLNERLRFIQYNRGERFVAHTDGEYSIQEGARSGWRSFITVQVYLTEGFEGGTTRFVNGDAFICDAVPKVGRVLVFEHCMRHTGEEITSDLGGTRPKRIIRTEVMYVPDKTKHYDADDLRNYGLHENWVEGADAPNNPVPNVPYRS